MNGPKPLNDGGPTQLGRYSSLQNTVFGLNSTFLILAIVAIALRFWSRRIKCMRFMVNDYVAAVALVVLLAFFAIIAYGLCTGMGRHMQDLRSPASQVPHLLKLMIPLQILWSTINTLVKLSMLDIYLRIFPAKRLRLASYVLLGIICTYWVIALLFALLNCRPFSMNWDKQTKGGKCLDPQGGTLGFGIINLILDIAVIVLPLPYLYTLQLKLHKKISLMAIFALGFIITAISAVRINTIISSWGKDFPVGASQIALWSFLETSLSVINSCLPTIQPALVAVSRSTSSLFSHPSIDERTLPTHKFITLTFDSASYASPRASALVQQPTKPRDIPEEETAQPSKKKSWWGTSFYEEKTEVDLEDNGTHPAKATKRLPPLPSERRAQAVHKVSSNEEARKTEW